MRVTRVVALLILILIPHAYPSQPFFLYVHCGLDQFSARLLPRPFEFLVLQKSAVDGDYCCRSKGLDWVFLDKLRPIQRMLMRQRHIVLVLVLG